MSNDDKKAPEENSDNAKKDLSKIRDILRKNAEDGYPKSRKELAQELGVNLRSVESYEQRMDDLPSRPHPSEQNWSPSTDGPQKFGEIDTFLKTNKHLPRLRLAELCGISKDAVSKRMGRLGLTGETANARGKKAIDVKIDEHIVELVRANVLIQSQSGVEELHKKVCEKFPEDKPGKKSFKRRVARVIWSGEADKALQHVVRMRLDVKDDFHQHFPYIPIEMVEDRARWHRGLSSKAKRSAGSSLPGIGRIPVRKELGNLSKFRMPQTDYKNPFTPSLEGGAKDFTVMVLNGANVGTRYGGDITSNVVRRALSDADFRRDKAVIMTNILSLDLKKAAGPLKVGRALVMGDNVNPDIFADEEYRKEVEEIVKSNPVDRIIYQNAEELLDNILSGYGKICYKPNKRLEYSGPIFIILGINEEELIRTVAYWEMNFLTKVRQTEIQSRLTVAKKALKEAEEYGELERIEEITEKIETLQDRLNRTRITNIATQESQRFYAQARALVVRKIEQAIPNAKVIGQGGTYMKLGNEVVEFHLPSHQRVTDTLLANYTGQYGPKNLRETLADSVVICHPWSLNFRMTVREADYDGKRGSSKVYVAPVAVDDVYLRKVLGDTVAKNHQLAKAVYMEQFQAGVMRLNVSGGEMNADIIYASALDAHTRYRKRKRGKKRTEAVPKNIPLYSIGPKYIWVNTGTDPHEGGRAKEWVVCKRTGKRFGMSDAVFEMMRREGLTKGTDMPVHLFAVNDDPTQGQNFPARTQPDPHQMSPWMIEELSRELLASAKSAKSAAEITSLLERMHHLHAHQATKRGTDFPLEQMFSMMERYVTPNVDIFSAILRRAQKAKLVIRGVGEYVNEIYGGFDTRNLAIINLGSGNHLDHTVDGEIVEGPFYASHLRLLLKQLPEWKKQEDFIDKAVTAPFYSGEAIAWGRFNVPDGYEYGFDLRASPPRMAGWGDVLLGAVKNDPLRGNYSRIFNGRLTLKTYGDKHFFAAVGTPYAFYHMSASGTHTDRYGERGFPPNNTGVSFVGLPADGPDSGPILLRILPYDAIRDYMEDNPRSFDWERFLPNPA